ncbi:MAG: SDR family NAD(P)-dependent oxidoreductase [Legionellales bacterium]|nr:SDR family NAD(P)-dependent oxidoreductase [Legionellales bacterium]
MNRFEDHLWALILGGSSGFGLASAKKLASLGMNVFIVHRDRKGSMERIGHEFDHIRSYGVQLETMNMNALDADDRKKAIQSLKDCLNIKNNLKLLLHSIAYGNLKSIAPSIPENKADSAINQLARKLNLDVSLLSHTIRDLFLEGVDELHSLQVVNYPEALLEKEDMDQTIYSMGTSLLDWVQDVFNHKLFANDARVLSLTSEGNQIAWKGYAAVSAAKVALESISRSIAVEFAPHGIRSNILQPGVTPTPALKLIPGSENMKAVAKLRNPFKRCTTPEDVANVVALMCSDEAAWINGTIIRVDGGESIASF